MNDFITNNVVIHQGDCRDVLPRIPAGSVHTCVTSPPYWGLRDYGVDGQIGLEKTLDEFVAEMVGVFREVRRVLRDDGTLWLNLGSSYCSGSPPDRSRDTSGMPHLQFKQKDLLPVPWLVALALQADGWYLRSDIIWHKPNPMPESVTDRPTNSHEYMFLLTKQARYFYDAEAVRTKLSKPNTAEGHQGNRATIIDGRKKSAHRRTPPPRQPGYIGPEAGANLRDVWTIPTKPYPGAHFATFPPALIEPCIKAGTSEEGCCPECGAPWVRVVEKNRQPTRPIPAVIRQDPSGKVCSDPGRHITTSKTTGWEPGCECNAGDVVPCTVLDPHLGTATTAEVARRNGCRCIGIELNEEYVALAVDRLKQGRLF